MGHVNLHGWVCILYNSVPSGKSAAPVPEMHYRICLPADFIFLYRLVTPS